MKYIFKKKIEEAIAEAETRQRGEKVPFVPNPHAGMCSAGYVQGVFGIEPCGMPDCPFWKKEDKQEADTDSNSVDS